MPSPHIAFSSRAPRAVVLGLSLTVALLGLGLAGCTTDHDVTGSIGPAATTSPDRLQADAVAWGRRYDADPADRNTALTYANILRRLDRTAQAVAVLENVAIKNPYDREVLASYGKALADVGRAKEAADVLERAHTPDKPDWGVLSAQGSVADQLGDHAGAQNYYAAALKIVPGNPAVLSNLGLSYALTKQLPLAEQTMRGAVASPDATVQVRQNLALVLALEGKFAEAETVSRTDLSAADAAASVAAIRTMIARSNTWRGVRAPLRPAVPAKA